MPRPLKRQAFRPAVAIVGDGHTERIYFLDVRDTDRPANLSIFPDYPRKIGHYKGVIDRALALTENYDRVYALIDMDKIIRDNQQNAYTADKAAAKTRGVIVLENNPCFEIWLLVHFIYTGRLFNNCMEVARQLRRNDRIPNYNKSEKFLQNARLYNSYKHLLCQQAISNAKQLENDRNDHDILFPRAQIFYFFEWYFEKVIPRLAQV